MRAWTASKFWDFITRRKECYDLTFRTGPGEEVLRDLSEFCRARETTFHTDARMHAVLEGRREVFLRIAKHLNLTDAEIFKEYSGGVSFDPSKIEE